MTVWLRLRRRSVVELALAGLALLLALLLTGRALEQAGALRWLGTLVLLPVILVCISRIRAALACVRLLQAMRRSREARQGRVRLQGARGEVVVVWDSAGFPDITAGDPEDGALGLGYAAGRDRLAQLELVRRRARGELAELFGILALRDDLRAAELGFAAVAEAVVARLAPADRAILDAYARGVNLAATTLPRPWELVALGVRPAPWTAADAVLVQLAWADLLAMDEALAVALSVMERTLPPEVCAFLTPDEDDATAPLVGGSAAHRPLGPIPVEPMARLLAEARARPGRRPPVLSAGPMSGSNAMAVSGARTQDGRALLSADLHTSLTLPGPFVAARVRVGSHDCFGLLVPGMPVFIAGRTEHLAWGVTALAARCRCYRALERDPEDRLRYRVPEGWERLERHVVRVRIGRWLRLRKTVLGSRWGPVRRLGLGGEPHALLWSVLDPARVDFGLLGLQSARDIEEAVQVATRAGGPALNLVLADATGRVAWTVTGTLPAGPSAATPPILAGSPEPLAWLGPEEHPRLLDPPAGVIVSANQRPVGAACVHALGLGFQHGQRAGRATALLAAESALGVARFEAIAMDLDASFYAFYRDIALEALLPGDPAELREALVAWSGRAPAGDAGTALLLALHAELLSGVLAPFLERCRAEEPLFALTWPNLDPPLRALLRERRPELLPDPEVHTSWEGLVRDAVLRCWRSSPRLERRLVRHLLLRRYRALRELLSLPGEPAAGSPQSLRLMSDTVASSARIIVSPGLPARDRATLLGGVSGDRLDAAALKHDKAWSKGHTLEPDR